MCITVNKNNPQCCFARVRELASLSSPWYFGAVPNLNASEYAASWETAFDPDGLAGEYGLRTAERRSGGYFCDNKRPGAGPHGRESNGCCKWSGPMWPFESSKAITAAINVLNNYPTVTTVDKSKLWTMLWQYTASHTPEWRLIDVHNGEYLNITAGVAPHSPGANARNWLFNGTGNLWIAESGCADKGNLSLGLSGPSWTDDAEQGYRYNHATFVDLVMSGVAGLQPLANGTLIVNPLIEAAQLPWWTVDGVSLHARIVSVAFDADGLHYKRGAGLKVWVDGVVAASSPTLTKLVVAL